MKYVKYFKTLEKFYVDDGCQSDFMSGDNVVGSYQPKSFKANVRCCSMEGDKCNTLGNCPDDALTFNEARTKCESAGYRLCTKKELLGDVCCDTGGNCDLYSVWTSTSITGTQKSIASKILHLQT